MVWQQHVSEAEIFFPNPWTLKLTIGDRSLTAKGEASYVDRDFWLYSFSVSRWDDGTSIEPDEREALVRLIVELAGRRGIPIKVV
ncbi:MAG: hypothetical protein KatS3mg007_1915 [Thermoanaerobaculum sp.]|jgi:hypothetical protein|nr:MAG: hypothetical protein KatS3mg007_1915 [Thermoanaerobaculum sp.]